MNIFLLLILCMEAVLLFLIEKKLWKTILTPLNFLMLPYMLVLGFTLIVSGRWGIADFYYPSLVPWIAGLPLFAIPGWICFLFERRGGRFGTTLSGKIRLSESNGRAYFLKLILTVLIVAALAIRLGVLLAQGAGKIGNEDFGTRFAGNGWAGHLLLAGVALMMLLLFEKRNLPTWIACLFILFFLFVYQVKSWIILPLLTVFLALLLTKKIKWKLSYLLWIFLGSAIVFFASFLLIYGAGNRVFPEAETFGAQFKSIAGMFVHYIISGTMGLSVDMQQGIVEHPNLQYIFTPFYNLWYVLSGQEMICGINGEYLSTGINLSNVRSFFGTLFVFTTPLGFVLCSLFFGSVSYAFFWLFRRRPSNGNTLVYAWVCVVLFMGWFEFLPCLLNIYEIPLWVFALWNICRL